MLFTRSLFSISTITCLVFSVVNAAPIQQQPSSTISQLYVPEAGFLLTESLSEYYENIVDQVMLDVSDQVLTTLPQTISHGDVEVRQLAQKSLNRNLNFMRASLLASVNPLVSTDIPQIAGLTTIQNEALSKLSTADVNEDKTQQMESILLESIMTLNKKISHQLGLIVNAEQSSSILIRQANNYPQHNMNKQDNIKSTVITVEWKLRQPFQINVIREEPRTISNVNDDMASETEWLFKQLSSVELNLLNEFNDRTLDAIQLVMESLALDI